MSAKQLALRRVAVLGLLIVFLFAMVPVAPVVRVQATQPFTFSQEYLTQSITLWGTNYNCPLDLRNVFGLGPIGACISSINITSGVIGDLQDTGSIFVGGASSEFQAGLGVNYTAAADGFVRISTDFFLNGYVDASSATQLGCFTASSNWQIGLFVRIRDFTAGTDALYATSNDWHGSGYSSFFSDYQAEAPLLASRGHHYAIYPSVRILLWASAGGGCSAHARADFYSSGNNIWIRSLFINGSQAVLESLGGQEGLPSAFSPPFYSFLQMVVFTAPMLVIIWALILVFFLGGFSGDFSKRTSARVGKLFFFSGLILAVELFVSLLSLTAALVQVGLNGAVLSNILLNTIFVVVGCVVMLYGLRLDPSIRLRLSKLAG